MTHKEEREQYKCRFCEKVYALPRTRDKHEFTHFGFTNLKCSKCKSRFSSLKSLEAHIDIYHGGSGEAEGYTDYEGIETVSIPQVQGYDEISQDAVSVASSQDSASVGGSEVNSFTAHTGAISGNTYHKEGTSNTYLNQDGGALDLSGNAGNYAASVSSNPSTTSNHKQRNHVCPICDQRFFFLLHLKQHIESHQVEPNVFQCNKCNQQFHKTDTFRKHLDSHPREVKCDMCNDSFHFQSELEEHKLKTHQTPTSRRMMCHICNSQRFRTATQLEYHILANHKLGSLDCPSCGLHCRDEEHYKAHYTFCHIKSKAFHCSYANCDKSYASEGHLKRHLISKHGHKK